MSYARFGDDLSPPDRNDIEKCDLCMNTVYVTTQPNNLVKELFECKEKEDSLNILGTITPEDQTIEKINGYTRSTLKLRVKSKIYTSNLEGGICKFIFICFHLL